MPTKKNFIDQVFSFHIVLKMEFISGSERYPLPGIYCLEPGPTERWEKWLNALDCCPGVGAFGILRFARSTMTEKVT